MTTSNEHNNAPAVPQGEPEAYMVYGNYTRQPFRSIESAQAYMGGLLKSDPEGGYHIRPLFYATPAAPSQEPAVPQGVPAQEVIDSIEAWKSAWLKVPPFADRVNKATREAITISHNSLFLLLQSAQQAQRMPSGCPTPTGCGPHGCHGACIAATPAPAPAQEVATLSLAAEDVHAAFAKNFPKSRISQAWINFAADIAQAIAARAAKPAQGEPFGYFRAEPFGWADCSEDAEGAIALYEHPAKPAQEVGLTDDEIDENTVWHDPDPHDNVHCDVSATVRKCLAALRAKGASE